MGEGMIRVVVASPFRGKTKNAETRNIKYAQQCVKDCFRRGEAAFAPHLIYPQMMRDNVEEERAISMQAGIAWQDAADALVVYIDRGVSEGMWKEINAAHTNGTPVVPRSIKVGRREDVTADEWTAILEQRIRLMSGGHGA